MPARRQLSLHDLYSAKPPTEAGTIGVPMLFLWGAQDGLLPRADQDTLVPGIEGAELKIYSEAAHLVLWECPKQVAADTTALLGSLE